MWAEMRRAEGLVRPFARLPGRGGWRSQRRRDADRRAALPKACRRPVSPSLCPSIACRSDPVRVSEGNETLMSLASW